MRRQFSKGPVKSSGTQVETSKSLLTASRAIWPEGSAYPFSKSPGSLVSFA